MTSIHHTNHLRALRRAHGLALWGLAVRCGVAPSTLSGVERWNYVPGPAVRGRIAEALGVAEHDIWPDLELPLPGTSEAAE